MIRYCKQKNKNDCAITAIVNAAKWSGLSVSYNKVHKHLSYLYSEGHEHGVPLTKLDEFLYSDKKSPLNLIETVQGITLKDLRKNVNANKACILLVPNGDRYHVCLVTEMSVKFAEIVNWNIKGKVSQAVYIPTLKKYLKKYAIGYIISRIGDF